MTTIFFCVIIPLALAWCAFLVGDTVRECRKIARNGPPVGRPLPMVGRDLRARRSTARYLSLSGVLEAR